MRQNIAIARIAAFAALVIGAAPSFAAAPASGAESVIKKTVDDAFAVLKDTSLGGKERRGQRLAALRRIADRAFEWAEMARSSLGAAWRSLDAR